MLLVAIPSSIPLTYMQAEQLVRAKDMQLVAAHKRAEAMHTEAMSAHSRNEALQAELALR